MTKKNPTQTIQLRSLAVDRVPAMVGFWDADLVCQFANQAYLEWFGKSPNQVIGRSMRDLMGDRLFAMNEPYIRGALKGEAQSFERVLKKPAGETGYTWARYLPEFDANELLGFFAVVVDITEIKILELKLQEKKDRFEKLFAGMIEGAVLQDQSGRIIEFNEAATKILGLTEDELLGRTSHDPRWETFKPDGSPFVSHEHPSVVALKTGIAQYHVPMIVKKPNGESSWISINAVPLFSQDASSPNEVIVTFSDLSELQQAKLQLEAALRSANELKLRQEIALEDSDIGIWEWDIQNNKLYWDEQMFRIYGVSREKFSNAYDAWANGLHPEDSERTQQMIKLAVEKDEPYKPYFRVVKGNGEIAHVLGRGKVIRAVDGTPLKMVGTNWDITKIKENEAALVKAQSEAKLAAEAKSLFLANMSHEIRTPLNAIIGMAGLALDGELTMEQRQYINIIQNSGTSLLAIINDILDFSKIEAGKLDFSREEFSLRTLVEAQTEILASKALEKNISLTTYVDPELCDHFLGDSGRIGQILLNLVGNAIKFTSSGGVNVRVVETQSHELSKNQRMIRVEVIDSGIGMSEADQAQLFQPFTQTDSSISKRFGGTGLGLSISKRLVDAMGGRIGVQSANRCGSTFWFELPLTEGSNPRTLSAKDTLDDLRDIKVLVLSSNEFEMKMLHDYIASWKMQSHSESKFENALPMLQDSIATKVPYRVVVIGSGENSGARLELARDIEDAFGDRAPKVIYLSHFGEKVDRSALRATGISEIVFKPVKQSDLYDAFMMALKNQSDLNPTQDRSFTKTEARAPLSPYRILVAEDVAVNQLLARRMLEKHGYSVHTVANGKEAIEALATGAFDLVLMDCQMPEMDGFEATRKIRAMEAHSGLHIPIVALTANAMSGDDKVCIQAGMDGYLSKPVKRDYLIQTLEKWLSGNSKSDKKNPA